MQIDYFLFDILTGDIKLRLASSDFLTLAYNIPQGSGVIPVPSGLEGVPADEFFVKDGQLKRKETST